MNLLCTITSMSWDILLVLVSILLISLWAVKVAVQLFLYLRVWQNNAEDFLDHYCKQLEELPSDFDVLDPVSATFKNVVIEWRKSANLDYSIAIDRAKRTYDAVRLQWFTDIEQQLDQLNVITTVTPYIGLLGTILGIMKCFSTLGAGNNPALLAPAIAESLISTGFSLAVAIFAMVAWNLLYAKLENISFNMQHFFNRLLSDLIGSRGDKK